MKIVAYMPLLYGREYLAWAVRSVLDAVDEFWFLYTPVGSHGARAPVPCPESRAELRDEAYAATLYKTRWYEGIWPHEGAQRDMIYRLAPDADVILPVDADEIWLPDHLQLMIDTALSGQYRHVLCRGIHFWRSFYRAVIDDYAAPVRAINPRVPVSETILDTWFAHMGYAQSERIVGYKQHTHGHRADWRQDWYTTKFLPNAQRDCHPTNLNFWNPVAVKPLDYLPDWMREHPYFNLDLIR